MRELNPEAIKNDKIFEIQDNVDNIDINKNNERQEKLFKFHQPNHKKSIEF